jgi:hypothetical protein
MASRYISMEDERQSWEKIWELFSRVPRVVCWFSHAKREALGAFSYDQTLYRLQCALTSDEKRHDFNTPSPYTPISLRYVATCFPCGFLLGLFFDPENSGNIFLCNVG